MGLCNVRVLSYISASVQLIVCICSFVLLLVVAIAAKSEDYEKIAEDGVVSPKALKILYGISALLCLVGICALVTLTVGIRQKRPQLLAIYVYTNCAVLIVGIIFIIFEVALDVAEEMPAGVIMTNVCINMAFFVLEIVFFVPIIVLKRRMRLTPILPTTYTGAVVQPDGRHLK